jgi:hypothetical protein
MERLGRLVQESRAGASSSSSGDDVVDPVNLEEMFFGENLSFARVAGDGFDGCIVGTRVGRCAWEAVYSANSPRSKPSSTASTLWRLALVPGNDQKAASAAAAHRSPKASRKMIRSLDNSFVIFFIWGPVCKRASVIG